MSPNFKETQIYTIIFITLVVLVAVSLLSAIDAKARPQIILQKQIKIEKMLNTIYPGMKSFTTQDGVMIVKGDTATIGYAITGKGKGYGGEIELLVGLDTRFAIKKAIVISQTETPGLGDFIQKDTTFCDRFIGLTVNELALRKAGGKVDARTGATISSKAVTDGLRKTIENKLETLTREGKSNG